MAAPKVSHLPEKIAASIKELQHRDHPINLRAVCKGVCSPQTLYDFDKSAPKSQSLRKQIADAAARQASIARRVKRRRGAAGDAALIEKLRAEAIDWRTKYEVLLEQVTLMEFHLKEKAIDMSPLYKRGMVKPDRSVSKAGRGKAGRDASSRGVRVLS